MTAAPGTFAQLNTALVGRDQLERELGRGGMAIVYLARDLRHERWVALKVLLPELSAVLGAERFLAEIRVTANLQHPHLLPLFDSGEAGGLPFYVMPYVDGESLRARLDKERQLPVDEAVRIAVAAAQALDYAHRHGVVHRDLKPANILLTAGYPGAAGVAQPLVADFGIALAVSNAGGARVTQTGISLGTPQYMSPEQATGDRQVDGRTDIYSLGAVLYEMLAGDPPHTGSTVQAVIAKVLTDRPAPVAHLRDTVPPHVSSALDRALAKIPADRWATAAQFAEALLNPASAASSGAFVATGSRASGPPGSGTRDSSPGLRSVSSRTSAEEATIGTSGARPTADIEERRPGAGALRVAPWLVAAASLAVAGWSLASTRAAPERTMRWTVAIPAEQRLEAGAGVAVAPDGARLAYVGRVGERQQQLYVRELDDLVGRPVAGTEGASWPTFSPDGRWIAYFAGGKLAKVPLGGGVPVTLADVPAGVAASWGDDAHVYLARAGLGISRVPEAGGPEEVLTRPDSAAGELGHSVPQLLPGAEAVLFTVYRGNTRAEEPAVLDLDDRSVSRLGISCAAAQYVGRGRGRGHLLCPQLDGTALAYPFDAARRRLGERPFVALRDVALRYGMPAIRVARDGTLLYVAGTASRQLVTVDRAGRETTLGVPAGEYATPRFSPDGSRIAVRVGTGTGSSDIWVLGPGGALARVTAEGDNEYPEWTPDGRRISFGSRRGAKTYDDLYVQPADGSGPAELLHSTGRHLPEGVWTPDGRSVVFRETRPGTGRDLGVVDVDDGAANGDGAPRRSRDLLATPHSEWAPRLSPDGRWLAYASDESGVPQVYVRPVPAMEPRWQVSTDGGAQPVWSRDGREIFYRSRDRIVAAGVSAVSSASSGGGGRAPAFAVASRATLFRDDVDEALHASYDVAPDGRFVVARAAADQLRMTVVANWFAELERTVR